MNGIQKFMERLARPEPIAIAQTARVARASSAAGDPCVAMVGAPHEGRLAAAA